MSLLWSSDNKTLLILQILSACGTLRICLDTIWRDMKTNRLLGSILLLTIAVTASSHRTAPRAHSTRAISDNALRAHIKFLSDDALEV